MLALSLTDKFCCFGIFVFVFVFNFSRFRFQSFSIFSFSFRFSFHHFFVLVLVFVNEFANFSFFTIFVFVFVNENHTAVLQYVRRAHLCSVYTLRLTTSGMSGRVRTCSHRCDFETMPLRKLLSLRDESLLRDYATPRGPTVFLPPPPLRNGVGGILHSGLFVCE